jgi:hypothetical protein
VKVLKVFWLTWDFRFMPDFQKFVHGPRLLGEKSSRHKKSNLSKIAEPHSDKFGYYLRRIAFALASTFLYSMIWKLHIYRVERKKEKRDKEWSGDGF